MACPMHSARLHFSIITLIGLWSASALAAVFGAYQAQVGPELLGDMITEVTF
jgi:hypothetical protein